MPNFQFEKRVVRDYYDAMDASSIANMATTIERFVTDDYVWRAFHPLVS